MSNRQPRVMPDSTYPGMYRVRWPDGRTSDMANLTRANDAIACFLESAERQRRRAAQPQGSLYSDLNRPEAP